MTFEKLRIPQGLLISVTIALISILTIGLPVPILVLALIGLSRFIYCIAIWIVYFNCAGVKFRYTFLNLIFYIIVCILLALPLIPYTIWVNQLTGYNYPPFIQPSQIDKNELYYYSHFYLLRAVMMSISIYIIQYRADILAEKMQEKLKNEQLLQQNLLMQLEVLKQQLSPHFLFNTLSSLKSLIQYDPKQAEFYTVELSNVYRYLLTHQKKQTVTVIEEIQFLKSYLSLLKIRFQNNFIIHISIEEPYHFYEIPPLCLQLLVENTVKHNIITKDLPLKVTIYIDNQERLVVKNNMQKREDTESRSQYGLFHLSEHYKILTGEDIGIEINDEHFSVQMPLINPGKS